MCADGKLFLRTDRRLTTKVQSKLDCWQSIWTHAPRRHIRQRTDSVRQEARRSSLCSATREAQVRRFQGSGSLALSAMAYEYEYILSLVPKPRVPLPRKTFARVITAVDGPSEGVESPSTF
jgi:hypothetical protein